MLSAALTHAAVRFLDFLAERILPSENSPEHQVTGRRGEEEAYFYLRRRGYIKVARNYRSPHYRGELDLIAWHKDVLCFVEVKTRTTRDVKPAEAAVDGKKQRELIAVAREYVRHLSPEPRWRMDVISVYYDGPSGRTQFELFQNAFTVS